MQFQQMLLTINTVIQLSASDDESNLMMAETQEALMVHSDAVTTKHCQREWWNKERRAAEDMFVRECEAEHTLTHE